MVQRIDVTGADGVRLAAWEFRESAATAPPDPHAPRVLLLHGLMGRAFHWAGTARWLARNRRVVALDQRGHGQSDRPSAARAPRPAWGATRSWPTPKPSSSSSAWGP